MEGKKKRKAEEDGEKEGDPADNAAPDASTVQKKRKARAKRDPNKPKRASPAFFFFSGDMRPKVMAEMKAANPEGNVMSATGKRLGELWKELGGKQKKKYHKMAEEDKARYAREMAVYAESGKGEEGDGDGDGDGEGGVTPIPAKPKKKKEEKEEKEKKEKKEKKE